MWRWQNLFFATCQKAPWAWRADIIYAAKSCACQTLWVNVIINFFSRHTFDTDIWCWWHRSTPITVDMSVRCSVNFFLHFFYLKAVAANLLPDFRSVCIWNAQHTAATFFWLRNIMLDESQGPTPFWNCSSTFAYFHDIFIYSYNIDMLHLILIRFSCPPHQCFMLRSCTLYYNRLTFSAFTYLPT